MLHRGILPNSKLIPWSWYLQLVGKLCNRTYLSSAGVEPVSPDFAYKNLMLIDLESIISDLDSDTDLIFHDRIIGPCALVVESKWELNLGTYEEC